MGSSWNKGRTLYYASGLCLRLYFLPYSRWLACLSSSSTDLLQVFTGLPTILLPCGFHSRACLVVSDVIHSADVPGPYLCGNLHRQKRYRPSGSRQGFTRWRHVALRGDLFASRAGTAQYCFRFCNQFYPLVGDLPSQLHRVPVSQHVSG